MRRWRSVRVRVTVLATAIVAIALGIASIALVVSLENTLAGRARNAAEEVVRATADDLRYNRPTSPSTTARALRDGVVVQVRDARGVLVAMIPGSGEAGLTTTTFGSGFAANPDAPAVDTPAVQDRLNVEAGVLGEGGIATYEETDGRILIRRIDNNDNIIVRDSIQTANGPMDIVAVTPLAEVAMSIDPVVRALQFGTPLLIVLVALVTWWIAGRALQPIEDLRLQAESISHSNLDEHLPVPPTGDEVARLAVTLNDMLERIHASAQRQREFLSDASHELRSPITSIHTALEVAQVHPETTTVPELSRDLLTETTRMQTMVNGLLTLARLEDGDATPLEPVDLGPAIAAVTGEPTSDLIVEADASQIGTALRNLVDNARHHAKSTVEVTVNRGDTDVSITVDDDGSGIPPVQRDRIFARFTRLDEGRSRADGGVGIGLALVRRIVDRHHGNIAVSDSPLGGARFTLTLPYHQPRESRESR